MAGVAAFADVDVPARLFEAGCRAHAFDLLDRIVDPEQRARSTTIPPISTVTKGAAASRVTFFSRAFVALRRVHCDWYQSCFAFLLAGQLTRPAGPAGSGRIGRVVGRFVMCGGRPSAQISPHAQLARNRHPYIV